MKITFERKDTDKILADIHKLSKEIEKPVKIMEVCGTHTMAIGKSGLRQLLPENIRLISGPGCPVCVTHDSDIEKFLFLAQQKDVIIATFGDLIRVPGNTESLADVRGKGAQVKVVYSALAALELARKNPDKQIVFLAVGFETTAPTIAMSIIQAKAEGLENYLVFVMHKLVPPALEVLFQDPEIQIDGLICPGHVSSIIGLEPYENVANKYLKASVITGFEPYDILQALVMLLEQITSNKPRVEIQYRRAVRPEGNPRAREVMYSVFEVADALWRGFGIIPQSGLQLREEFQTFNVVNKFVIPEPAQEISTIKENCVCGDILKGIKMPDECKLFMKACTPSKPIGPCMVSSEGACAAYYKYGGSGG